MPPRPPAAGLLVLALAGGLGAAGPHDRPLPTSHPRLFAAPSELEELRTRLQERGSVAAELFVRAATRVPAGGSLDYVDLLHATAPMAALLLPTEAGRKEMARRAIDAALAIVRRADPPYPDEPEWIEWFQYRYLAIAYDACHGEMTEAERAEVREEILRACALAAAFGIETTANNHWVVAADVLGLCALAIEGDVEEEPRRIEAEAVVRSKDPADHLAFRSGTAVEAVRQGGTGFAEGKDFAVRWRKEADAGFGILWLPGGRAPATGSTYDVTYRFTPEVGRWIDLARRSITWNLDHVWSEGACHAGVMYGAFTLWWEVDLFEAMRRRGWADLGAHPSLDAVPAWLASELISDSGLATNDRNDSTLHDAIDGLARAAPYLAWLTSRRRGDAESHDATPWWLLERSELWKEHADWREAIWYRPEPRPEVGAPPLRRPGLPGSRFFRGHDLANFRAGWLQDRESKWALLSLNAGPLTMAEHDHTDRGAFTFYALGEDWAVDSGYAQGDARSDSTAAHNYVLIDGKGQAGAWGSSARAPAWFLSKDLDAVHADLSKTWVPYSQWLSWPAEKPWPVRRADRYAALLRYPEGPPIAVIADAIDVDGREHVFEWLLHTRAGNRVVLGGGGAEDPLLGRAPLSRDAAPPRIDAARGPSLALDFASSSALSFRADEWVPRDGAAHPRLVAATRAPRLGLLATLTPSPTATEAYGVGGARAGAGWRTLAPPGHLVVATDGERVEAGDVETDAGLAVVRLEGASAAAWLVLDGSFLRHGSRVLFAVEKPRDTKGSACFDDGRLRVTAPDATAFTAWAPGVAEVEADGVPLPVSSKGGVVRGSWKRPLRDAAPEGRPVLSEDFSRGLAPWFFVLPAAGTGFTRVVDGELCCPGVRHEWVSWTRRNFNRNPWQLEGPPRADVFSWPRLLFGDSTLSGTLAVHSWRPGGVVRIAARVRDRTYPVDAVDQDLVQVEVEPATGRLVLSSRLEGKETRHSTFHGSPWKPGERRPFELSTDGASVLFTLDGSVRLRGTLRGLPEEGYFQWEVDEGVHLHLDDLEVRRPR